MLVPKIQSNTAHTPGLVQKANRKDVSFGKIVLSDNRDKELFDEVIKYDFNTPELKEKYKRLVLDQESNPVNIYLDLFPREGEIPLHPSGWFQKATVGEGILKRTFKQATWYLDTPPNKIKFLQRACLYADILKFFRLGK